MALLIHTHAGFARLARITLRLTICVVLWGAFTRLSGSGDGCGESWPLCQGVLIPKSPTTETIIEFLHRATSGVVFLLSVALAWSSTKLFHREQLARRAATWSLILMVIEAAIGAVLVIFGWVDRSESPMRVLSLTLHLINTFFLLSALALTAYFASHTRELRINIERHLCAHFSAGFALLCLSGVFGVVAALSSMLYPATSLWEGIQADLSAASPLIVRLRILHPFISVLASCYLIWIAKQYLLRVPGVVSSPRRTLLIRIVICQLLLGVMTLLVGNVLLMKLLHLLVADLLVIVFAILWAEAVTKPATSTA